MLALYWAKMLEFFVSVVFKSFAIMQGLSGGECLHCLHNAFKQDFHFEFKKKLPLYVLLVISSTVTCYFSTLPLYQIGMLSLFWFLFRDWIYPTLHERGVIFDKEDCLIGTALAVNYKKAYLDYTLKPGEGVLQSLSDFEKENCPRPNHKYFNKLIVFLPESCVLLDKGKRSSLETEGVFKESDIEIRSRNGQPDIKVDIRWIFKHKYDEQMYKVTKRQNPVAEKIVFVCDFPMLLKSCMSQDKGFDQKTRSLNLKVFKKTLQKFYNKPILFLSLPLPGEKEESTGLTSISDQIREAICPSATNANSQSPATSLTNQIKMIPSSDKDSEEPYVDVGSERIMVDQVGGHIAGYLRQRQIRESIRES